MTFKNQKGAVLVFSLFVIFVLLILGSIFILRTVSEKSSSDTERMLTQALYLADGGSEEGLNQLDILINTDMFNTVNGTNPQKVGNDAQSSVSTGDCLTFLVQYVKNEGTPQFNLNGSQAEYHSPLTSFGKGTYQYNILVTQKSPPVTISVDVWDFPFYYRIESTGTVLGKNRKVVRTGDFTIRVQRDNFAKYALFTDHHTLPSGTPVWFTNKTNFAGPIHTNERYNFALNPSGTFEGMVAQHLPQARFYNGGSPVLADADSNPPFDVPTFNAGYNRGEDEIVLESSVQKQDLYDQACGGANPSGNGIFVPNNGTSLTGGVFVRGDSSIDMSVDVNDNAVYTISQGGTTKKVTVDITNNQTTVETIGGGVETYTGLPDGIDDLGTIIYVEGNISSLKGTVQRDTEITVSCETNIVVTDHILYSEYTPAVGNPGDAGYIPPNASGAVNLLGLVAWGGDIIIGTTAPDDLNMHSVLMARNGVFTVDDYYDTGIGPRGEMTLLGGVITQFYGAFGLFNGATGQQLSGYGRNFNYDSRTSQGKSPPYFPSLKTFIAFTNDLTDKIAWQEGGF